ncbi:MAG: MFS transporter [Caulobacteraceae bacterium]|nr:MFS transporter [Caulobacteraceae bacterium]
MDEPTASEPPSSSMGGRRGWLFIALFFLLYGVSFLDRQVLTLLVDPIRKDLGVTDSQIGLLHGFGFVVFYVIFALPIGWAADRLPRKLIIFYGLAFWSLAAAAGGLARSFGQLLVARAGVGAGEASLLPSASSMFSDLFPKERLAGVMAMVSAGSVVGGAVSLALGGLIVGMSQHAQSYALPLIGPTKPWQLVFILAGLPGLVLAPLVLLIAEPKRRGRLATAAPGLRGVSLAQFFEGRWRFYVCHFAGFGCFNLATGGYTAWAPTFLMRSLHVPVSKAGLYLGLLSLCGGVFGMLFSGHLVDHLFRRGLKDAHLRYYVWACAVMAVAGWIAFNGGGLPQALAGMLVISLIAPFIAVATASLQVTTPNEFRGQISAAFLVIYNLVGFGLGPLLMAVVSDSLMSGPNRLGHAMAVVFVCGAALASLSFSLGLKPMRKAVTDASAWSNSP